MMLTTMLDPCFMKLPLKNAHIDSIRSKSFPLIFILSYIAEMLNIEENLVKRGWKWFVLGGNELKNQPNLKD